MISWQYDFYLLVRWHLYCHYSLALWLASPNSLAFDKATGIDRWHYGLLLLVRWHLIGNCHYLLALSLPSPGSLALDKTTALISWCYRFLILWLARRLVEVKIRTMALECAYLSFIKCSI